MEKFDLKKVLQLFSLKIFRQKTKNRKFGKIEKVGFQLKIFENRKSEIRKFENFQLKSFENFSIFKIFDFSKIFQLRRFFSTKIFANFLLIIF